VFEAAVDEDVPWSIVDMGAYSVPDFEGNSEDALISAADQVRESARRNWTNGLECEEPKVIIGASVHLSSAALDQKGRLVPPAASRERVCTQTASVVIGETRRAVLTLSGARPAPTTR
jgi:hypothetical protein